LQNHFAILFPWTESISKAASQQH